jgi:hypothetical protein
LITELKDKEKEVSMYEAEIKGRHNTIDKRQLKVDKLNRIWAQLKDAGVDENSGPMEAKRANIQKEKENLEESIIRI